MQENDDRAGKSRAKHTGPAGTSCIFRHGTGAHFAASAFCASNFVVRAATMKTYGATSAPAAASRSTTFLMNDWAKKNMKTSSLSVTLVTEPCTENEPLWGISATGDTYEILLVNDEIIDYAVI